MSPGDYVVQFDSGPGLHRYNVSFRVTGVTHHLDLGSAVEPDPDGDEGTITAADPRDQYAFTVPEGGAWVYLGCSPGYPAWVPQEGDPSWLQKVCRSWH